MSKVPTYVQAIDGKFYQEPTIIGEGWFICFDDDDPPELVIEQPIKKAAVEILKSTGIHYTALQKHSKSQREFDGKTKKAISYFFHLHSRIPVPQKFDKAIDRPSGDCVFYEFPAT
jgi:hypothetical protein